MIPQYGRRIGVIILALVSGCDSRSGDADKRSGGGQTDLNFRAIQEDDAEMNSAIKSAQTTLQFFEKNWKTMPNDGYSLKFAIRTSDGDLEHIWFAPTGIHGDQFTGECANEPVNVPGLKLHDVRTVSREAVTDWMIVVGRKCYGGYTIRVISKREPENAPPLIFVDPPKEDAK
jgi:uncharacterized protein YegJ (DUF2314 family)